MNDTPTPQHDPSDSEAERPKFKFSEPTTEADYERVRKAKAELEETRGENRKPLSVLRFGSSRETSSWMRYSGMGLQMVAVLLLPIFAGLWMDSQLETSPLGILVGSGIGIVGSMATVILTVTRQEKREEREAASRKR